MECWKGYSKSWKELGSALLWCGHYSFMKNRFRLDLKFWSCSELTATGKAGLSGAELSCAKRSKWESSSKLAWTEKPLGQRAHDSTACSSLHSCGSEGRRSWNPIHIASLSAFIRLSLPCFLCNRLIWRDQKLYVCKKWENFPSLISCMISS